MVKLLLMNKYRGAFATLMGILFLASTSFAVENLKEALINSPKLKEENVAEPIRAVIKGYTLTVPNPDKKSWDIVQVYFAKYGGPNEIITIDTVTDEIKRYKLPAIDENGKWIGQQWHMPENLIGFNGKLYIGTSGIKQYIHMYDPATNKLHLKWATLPKNFEGEGHPMKLGTDGKIYAGAALRGSDLAGICQIDPETGKVVDFGPVGGKNSHGVAQRIASDDRYSYVVTGKVPWVLSVYDRQTKKTKELLNGGKKGISLYQHADGCNAAIGNQVYWLKDGKAIAAKKGETAPWSKDKKYTLHWVTHHNGNNPKLPPKPEIFTKNAEAASDGKCVLWYRTNSDSKKAKAAEKAGTVFTTPEAAGWKAFRYTVETFPKTLTQIISLPDGRIFGVGKDYSGEFIYDPKTKKAKALGKTGLSVYTMVGFEGRIFMSGYPRALTYEFDPAKPWTRIVGGGLPGVKVKTRDNPDQNPRMVGFLSLVSGAHKMYASAVGGDGYLYFGGRWKRNGNGGGFAWWDPVNRTMAGISKIFSNYQIHYLASTNYGTGRYVVISTSPVTDITFYKKKPKTGRLFVFDTKTKKIIHGIDPVPKAYGSGLIAGADGDHVIGLASFGKKGNIKTQIYKLNAKTGKIVFSRTLDVSSNFSFISPGKLGPDKQLWTFFGGYMLARINPETGKVTPVGRVGGGSIAFSGNDLYLGGRKALRCVRNIVKKKK